MVPRLDKLGNLRSLWVRMILRDTASYVELRVLCEELEPVEPPSPDDWLVIQGTAGNADQIRMFDGLSLYREEALELAAWLRATARGQLSLAMSAHVFRPLLQFAEPDIAVRAGEVTRDRVTTRWYFYDEHASTTQTCDDINYDTWYVDVCATRVDIELAADAWVAEVEAIRG